MSFYEVSSSEGNIMKYAASKYPFSSARLFTKKQLNRIQLREERLEILRSKLNIFLDNYELLAVLEEMREAEKRNLPYIRHKCIITSCNIYTHYYKPTDLEYIRFNFKKWKIKDSTNLVNDLYRAGREMFGEVIELNRVASTIWRNLLEDGWE